MFIQGWIDKCQPNPMELSVKLIKLRSLQQSQHSLSVRIQFLCQPAVSECEHMPRLVLEHRIEGLPLLPWYDFERLVPPTIATLVTIKHAMK